MKTRAMSLDYLLKEGFIEFEATSRTGFEYRIASEPARPYVFVPGTQGFQSMPMIVNMATGQATFVTTDFLAKYSVKKENVVPGFEFVSVDVPAADDPSLL